MAVKRKERAIISPLPAVLFGPNRYVLWLAKDAKAEKAFLRALQSQDSDLPIFLDRAGYGVGTLDLFMKKPLRKKHLLGGLQFRVLPDKIVVSHMIVDAKHRRRGLNSFMIQQALDSFGLKKAAYYAPTKAGAAFVKARGGEVSKTNPPRGDDEIRLLERELAGEEYPAREKPEVWAAYRRALNRVGRVPPGQAMYGVLVKRAAGELRKAAKLMVTEVQANEVVERRRMLTGLRSAATRLSREATQMPSRSAWDNPTYYGPESPDVAPGRWTLTRETQALSMVSALIQSAASLIRAVAFMAERADDGEAALATRAWASINWLVSLADAVSNLRDRYGGHSTAMWDRIVERKVKFPGLLRD